MRPLSACLAATLLAAPLLTPSPSAAQADEELDAAVPVGLRAMTALMGAALAWQEEGDYNFFAMKYGA
jgi:hypothetical protein